MANSDSGFDDAFDFFDDTRAGKDPDTYSRRLRTTHQFLWSKPLRSGEVFAPTIPTKSSDGYLIHTGPDGTQTWYGSDAITNSYTRWTRPRALVDVVANLDDAQRAKYLNPPYTIGSSMIWPVRSADRPTINQARGTRWAIADRMDLTLECVRRHYEGNSDSPLADVLRAYGDFFALFEGFDEFVEFFHLQDLVSPDHTSVNFFLPFKDFSRPGVPLTTNEYVTYAEATLDFIAQRRKRIKDWVDASPNSSS